MENIIYCMEHSGISKETLKNKIEEIHARAEKACAEGGIFEGRKVEDITFYWFKNWLHPALKHRTAKPNPNRYNMANPDELKEFNELWTKHFYENGQQNFSYTMEEILQYIEEV